MQQTLIHIGYHKTGSTFLQKKIFPLMPAEQALMANVDYLAERDDFSVEEFKGALAKEFALRFDSSFILSQETLSGRADGNPVWDVERMALRLNHTFPQAKILLVIREQRDYLLSLYTFRAVIRGAETRSLEEFLHEHEDMLMQKMQYDRLVATYHELFGVENVLVLPYESLVQDHVAFVGKISSFAGLPLNGSYRTGRVNSGVRNQSVIRLHCFLNRLAVPCLSLPFRKREESRTSYEKRLNRYFRFKEQAFNRALNLFFDPSGNPLKMEGDAFDSFESVIRESNHRLAMLVDLDCAALGYLL